ncbi:MAG TPA: PAS domain S-box protein [Candidatus Acidoferrum sp.]|nr:PAS domain S-box protein [Candidatus Acidoferrum sp.]
MMRLGAQTGRGADAECYRVLVDGIADYAIFLVDGEGRIATWNAGAERITGHPADAAVGQHVSRVYLEEDVRARKPAAELHAAAAQGRFEADGWRRRRDGSRFWASTVVTALRDGAGGLLGFAVVARDDTERRLHEEALGAAQDRLRALAAHVDAAAEREKARLAREIHDVLGQELTGLKMDIAWIGRRLAAADREPAGSGIRDRLAAMGGQVDGCIQTIRRIATGLRPTLLDDLGLAAAIEWQAREFESRSGLTVEVSLPEDDLSVERERAAALFRILQELLTNVARHAAAHQVRVRLEQTERCLVLEVADDGRGIDQAERARSGSLGILGIRERVAAFGGTLELRGGPGRGTTAVVRVPVRHE